MSRVPPSCALSTVTVNRDFGPPEESTYMAMTGKRCESGIDLTTEPIYANSEVIKPTPLDDDEQKPITPIKRRNSRPLSIDEKVASYYPNEGIYAKPRPRLDSHKTPSPKSMRLLRARNNIYTSPPVRETSPTAIPKSSSRSSTDLSRKESFSPVIPKHQGRFKYATIGRSEGRRCLDEMPQNEPEQEDNAAPIDDTTSSFSRRFGSLPRGFKRFNFSPIKHKLNSVLHRYQSGM